ncbi:hypothetical protein pipiens_003675 [Culex pipiens pipiens]|uniref:General transcription factor 3C polypeptide 5 n=2 Tax=Culex pipiens TaxID=7175 RepID=A0ABD1CU78_CULPP
MVMKLCSESFTMECDPKNSHKHNLQKELVCIEYPGQVRNPDRMMASLGGALELSTAITTEKRRLELRFRPDSIYSKPAFGDRHQTTGLVLKLKIRRKRSQPNEVQVRSIEIAGRVNFQYRFESMCDFQLLPAMRSTTTGVVECMYDSFVPSGVITNPAECGTDPVPYFLPPISFSRFDTSQLNIFKAKDVVADLMAPGDKERARRTKHGIYQGFTLLEPLPQEPNPLAPQTMKAKNVPQGTIDLVRNKFQERPVWTKTALKCALQLSEDDIRYVLPSVALYFVNGPWRGTWVRFGYDPRQFFDARYYQLLDFRIRTTGAMHDKVKVKRSQNPIKPCMRFANPSSNIRDSEKLSISRSIAPKTDYIFTADTLPQMRIIFYQYCDVQVPQIQQMLEKIPTPLTGAVCNEKTGWLPARFDEQCRNILTDIVLANFRKKREGGGGTDTNTSASEFEETEGDETERTFDEEEDESDDSDAEKILPFD